MDIHCTGTNKADALKSASEAASKGGVPGNLPQVSAEHGHTDSGTLWDQLAAAQYATARHGADGDVFLDPHFLRHLGEGITGQDVIDIGCGASPWAIEAVKRGAARVEALDNAQGMVEQSKLAIESAGLTEQINVEIGDAASLKHSDATFDKAISINVGCNLCELTSHVSEISRVLKEGGVGIITAPDNFGTVFTREVSKAKKSEIVAALREGLKSLPAEPGLKDFQEIFNSFDSVLRATFAKIDDKWTLITKENEHQLIAGQEIFRKIPGLIVPNRYHEVGEYVDAIKASDGLTIERLYVENFDNLKALEQHNMNNPTHQLGAEYSEDNPFAVFVVRKS